MDDIKKTLLRGLSSVLAVTLLVSFSGCGKSLPTGADFEDVTYTVSVKGEANTSSDDTPSEESSKPTSNTSVASSSDNSSTNQEEETEKNSQYVKNWPVLLNPNGFNINSTSNINKFGCTDGRITVNDFLPNVAYLENGVAKDTMFDSFAFMPTPNFIIDYASTGDENEKPMTKSDWSHFVHDLEFRDGYNVDALENATGQVKQALDMPDYKVGVYLSIMKPVSSVTDWGTINGKKITLTTDEGKIEALKWLVDESIAEFNSHHYKNLELCGFYYYQEYVHAVNKPFLNGITDYIRSKHYITIWVPFYNAPGYSNWKDYGFDRASLQANYFPGATLPNGGGVDRIKSCAFIGNRNKMGFEIELAGTSAENIGGLKEYLKGSINYDFQKKYHTWWIMGGPSTVKTLYRSKDNYIHSTYYEIYLFLHRELSLSNITEK